MDTGGFYVKSPPTNTTSQEASSFSPSPATPDEIHDSSSGKPLQEDNKKTENSTVDEVTPDISGDNMQAVITLEGTIPNDSDIDEDSEKKMPINLCKSEDSGGSELACPPTEIITSDPSILGTNIPEDIAVVEIPPVSSESLEYSATRKVSTENPGDQSVTEEELPAVSENLEIPLVVSDNSEDQTISVSPALEDTDSESDPVVKVSPRLRSSDDDSLTNINYEKPEDDEEDIPDGFASILRSRKESNKGEMIPLQDLADSGDHCVITIISRRSRHRAGAEGSRVASKIFKPVLGTRYRRRGIDSTGAVANYIETEQV